MTRIIMMIIGYCCVALGVVGMLTPIPLGLFFFVLSLMFLIPTSPRLVAGLQKLRRKSARFDRMMSSLSRRLPSPYRRLLRQTDVDIMDRTRF